MTDPINNEAQATSQHLTEQQVIAWSREAYQKATAFLAENGIVSATVSMEQSRYLAPVLAIWKIKSTDEKWYWVISGDLPTDMMTEQGADSARSAVRAFSYQWQMKGENIAKTQTNDETQQQFAQLLIGRANGLYQLSEREDLWHTA